MQQGKGKKSIRFRAFEGNPLIQNQDLFPDAALVQAGDVWTQADFWDNRAEAGKATFAISFEPACRKPTGAGASRESELLQWDFIRT